MRKFVLLAALSLMSMASGPARAQFCPGVSPWVFDDVAASDPFCGYITWMAENGITLGCQIIDANHRLYCPNANVTRAAMAAFMNRLGNVRVEAVDTGPGLTGGPITSVGTINLATTQLLPTTACATNQIPKWNGTAWACANDASGTGTVTSIAAGSGLTGGTITTSGTLAVDTSAIQSRVTGTCAAGSSIRAIAADGTVTCQADNTGPANAYVQGGNAFGATAVLGTTDNNAIDIRVNGSRAMRLEPNATSPNVIGGHPNNSAAPGAAGQIVAGGGAAGSNCFDPFTGTNTRSCGNQTTGSYATVSGGHTNLASGSYSVVAGGDSNTASADYAVVTGGSSNVASGPGSMVLGGGLNTASGGGSVAMGASNTASGTYSTVSGTINVASGNWSVVPGGVLNIASGAASFAGGYAARTQTAGSTPIVHDGAFVWSDYNTFTFNTEAANEFAVRATGGVRFVTAIVNGNPSRTVRIGTNGELDFSTFTRQMINLWGAGIYGIGVQANTQYQRSASNFAWFTGGSHSDNTYDPGAGGSVLATLQAGASATTVTGTFRAQAFTTTSDRTAKTDFATADAADVLEKVVSLPIATWSYRNEQESGVRHIGPTAQDFKERFGVGYDDKTIATVDADGVALAAIQGLNAKLEAKIAEQAREIADLKSSHAAELAEVKRALEVLLARTSPEGRIAAR